MLATVTRATAGMAVCVSQACIGCQGSLHLSCTVHMPSARVHVSIGYSVSFFAH